jgi:hypothetical protein
MSLQLTDHPSEDVVLDGKYAKIRRAGNGDGLSPELLWETAFPRAVAAAKATLLKHRRHFGREEVRRIRNARLVLDLRPADAILEGFDVAIQVHDRSAEAAFLAGSASALLGRNPPLVACTGAVEETPQGYVIRSVAGLDAKFRYAAASRHFEVFCHPPVPHQGDRRYAGFQELLQSQDRDHVTLARTFTADDILDVALGGWRRYQFVRCEHLRSLAVESSDRPSPALGTAFREAPVVWAPDVGVAEVLRYLRACGAEIAELNRTGRVRAVPGISYTVLGVQADDSRLPLCSMLWDLANAPASSFLDFSTAADDGERLRLLAAEAFRTKPFGGLSNARGPDLLILVGWPNYAQGVDDFGRPGELVRMLTHPDSAVLRDDRRNNVWRRCIGDVRVILLPEPEAVTTRIPLDLEEQIVLGRMSACRDAAPATRIATMLPENFGSFGSPSELDEWIEVNLATKGLVVRQGGRWALSQEAYALGREQLRWEDDAELESALSKSYTPQLSFSEPYMSTTTSQALWGTDIYEFIYHFQKTMKRKNLIYHARWLSSALLYDLNPNWAVLRFLASVPTHLNVDQAIEVGRVLAEHGRWKPERILAEDGGFKAFLVLIERRLRRKGPLRAREMGNMAYLVENAERMLNSAGAPDGSAPADLEEILAALASARKALDEAVVTDEAEGEQPGETDPALMRPFRSERH